MTRHCSDTLSMHWFIFSFTQCKIDLRVYLSFEVLQEKHRREGYTKYWEYSNSSIKSTVEKESDSLYLVMREPRFSSAHTHSWTPHRDPTTTKSKPPHSSHIASSHWVTGTLSKARGKRVVKHVSLRELLSQSGNQLTTARQRASTQMYFWGAPIGWVHSMKTGFFRSSVWAEWFTESLIFEQSFELLNVSISAFTHTNIKIFILTYLYRSLWLSWKVNWSPGLEQQMLTQLNFCIFYLHILHRLFCT